MNASAVALVKECDIDLVLNYLLRAMVKIVMVHISKKSHATAVIVLLPNGLNGRTVLNHVALVKRQDTELSCQPTLHVTSHFLKKNIVTYNAVQSMENGHHGLLGQTAQQHAALAYRRDREYVTIQLHLVLAIHVKEKTKILISAFYRHVCSLFIFLVYYFVTKKMMQIIKLF